MSKKSKQKVDEPKVQQPVAQVEEVSQEATPLEEPVGIISSESAQVSSVPADKQERTTHSEHGPLYELDEAARMLVQDFNPGWLPSLKAYASSHGLSPQCPLALWSWLFKSWGAVLKV